MENMKLELIANSLLSKIMLLNILIKDRHNLHNRHERIIEIIFDSFEEIIEEETSSLKENLAKICDEWSVTVFDDNFTKQEVEQIAKTVANNLAFEIRNYKV